MSEKNSQFWKHLAGNDYHILAISVFFMYLLFIASPLQLNDLSQWIAEVAIDERKNECSSDTSKSPCEEFYKALAAELQKANTEIQERLKQEAEWFKLKYYVVGVIFLGFMLNAFLKFENKDDNTIEDKLHSALTSPVTSFILSIALVVGISIDMQIRSSRIVINQLGIWIGSYVEPLTLGASKTSSVGWEGFLRADGGYHADYLYSATFWTNIYYLSLVLYAFYLVVLRSALAHMPALDEKASTGGETLTQEKLKKQKTFLKGVTWFGFGLLQVTLLVAALSSNLVPSMFKINYCPICAAFIPIPLVEGWTGDPRWSAMVVLLTWMILGYTGWRYATGSTRSGKSKEGE